MIQEVVLGLIRDKINKGKEDKVPGFLIDGYPREVAQGLEFEKEVSPRVYLDIPVIIIAHPRGFIIPNPAGRTGRPRYLFRRC